MSDPFKEVSPSGDAFAAERLFADDADFQIRIDPKDCPDEGGRRLLSLWEAAAVDGVPSRKIFEPHLISDLARWIAIGAVGNRPGIGYDFRFLYIGTELERINPVSAGNWMSSYGEGLWRTRAQRLEEAMFDSGRPVLGVSGRIAYAEFGFLSALNLVLPLSSDGRGIDKALLYYRTRGR